MVWEENKAKLLGITIDNKLIFDMSYFKYIIKS